jgi:hypothetical protein
MKKKIHGFQCPHGRVKFKKHPRGFYLFVHSDQTPCDTLSYFTTQLKDFTVDRERKPPSLQDAASVLFQKMSYPYTMLLSQWKDIEKHGWSLKEAGLDFTKTAQKGVGS